MQRGARSGSFGCGAGEHSKSRPAGLTGIQEAEPDARKAFTGGPRCTSGYPIAQWQGGRRPSRWHGSTRDRRSAQRRHDAASCPGRRAGRPWPAAVSLMLPGDFLRETRAMRCDDVRPLCASAKSSYSSLDMLAGCAYTCLYMGEGLSVWTGRDSKVAARRHTGREGVHPASVIGPVGVPQVDRVDVTDFGNPN